MEKDNILTFVSIIRNFIISHDKSVMLQQAHDYFKDGYYKKTIPAKCVLILVALIVSLWKENLFRKAGYLTYNAALSVVPIFAIGFSIARGFNKETEIWIQLEKLVGDNGLLTEKIIYSVDKSVQLTNDKSGLFFVAAIIVFIYTSNSAICSLQDTFNDIWGIKNKKGFFVRLPLNMFILFTIPLVVIIIENVFGSLTILFIHDNFFEWFIRYLCLVPLLTIIYKVMPETKVKKRYAFIASLLSCSLLVSCSYIYIKFQDFLFNYNKIYGSFAIIPFFLFWVNTSWIVCLGGMKLNQLMQDKDYKRDNNTGTNYSILKEFQILLLVASNCSRLFRNEKQITLEEISKIVNIPNRYVCRSLSQLELFGFIIGITKQQKTIYYPLVPMDSYTVGDFIRKIANDKQDNLDIPQSVSIISNKLLKNITDKNNLLLHDI